MRTSSPQADRPTLRVSTAVLLFAVVVLAWGINWTVTKTIVADVTPLWTVALRSAIASVALLVLLISSGRFVIPRRADLPVVVVVSVFHMVGFSTLVAAGLTLAPVGRSIVLGYTTPIWVVPAAYLFLGEAITPRWIAGTAIALAGLATLFDPGAFDWTDGNGLAGSALILGAACSWAVSIVYVRSHRWVSTPFQLVFWQALLAASLLSATAMAVDGPPTFPWSPQLVLAFAYAGLIGTALAYWAMVLVNRTLPAVTTALGILATPIVGIGAASLILGEPVTFELILAVALVAAGIGLGATARP